jgi:hypothetical protein
MMEYRVWRIGGMGRIKTNYKLLMEFVPYGQILNACGEKKKSPRFTELTH